MPAGIWLAGAIPPGDTEAGAISPAVLIGMPATGGSIAGRTAGVGKPLVGLSATRGKPTSSMFRASTAGTLAGLGDILASPVFITPVGAPPVGRFDIPGDRAMPV